jgi:hypothetical protein
MPYPCPNYSNDDEYVTCGVEEPPSTEPRALSNWKAISRLAFGFICLRSNAWTALSWIPQSAKENWESLRDHHRKEGPVMQVAFLQRALTMQFTKDIPLPETAERISLIEHSFAMGTVTSDLLCCIAPSTPSLPMSPILVPLSLVTLQCPCPPHPIPRNIRLGK